ncbi:formate C-acetyltransferase, partial [Candidatus Micrarchaeota archaeon]|nr:formate C-acetyltransferase [Candidatus Micrarchaeota archaeon]
WCKAIELRDFIQKNYEPYLGGVGFLSGPTKKTAKVWEKTEKLLEKERQGKIAVDEKTPSSITSHAPGYIDEKNEVIVGLQTDEPLKRAIKPFGGIRMVETACKAYGVKVPDRVKEIFTKYRKTHSDAVFDVYTPAIRKLRRAGVITGLPDAYGRGRIIGDYRRVALYGTAALAEAKKNDFENIPATDIRLREEVAEQIKSLEELRQMAEAYGFDISRPAGNAREAIQWTWFAYLAAVKEQDGAAMSFGRVDSFFDAYIQRDMKNGVLDEKQAQELIDQLVIKMRLVRHLRTPEYDQIFAGDPTWVTLALAGMSSEPLVTKTTFRFLNTLTNIGPAPEPNLTVLWSQRLPREFKDYSCKLSVETSALQYENDDLMSAYFSDDYSISCCVSAMRTGKEMQFFGARCNAPKVLLLAINSGRDEISGEQIAPKPPFEIGDHMDYDQVKANFMFMTDWLAENYVNAMNFIHYMHDKYYYERIEMALHDTKVKRFMAFGLAGLSVVTDSLSAIKYAKVKAVRDERGIAKDFIITGDYPSFGNDDPRPDHIAIEGVVGFMNALKRHPTYRNAEHTCSILTITSNVLYGKKTGATPDGRKAGAPFAPGANPMHGREHNGAIASLNSVAKIPYSACLDGISNTFTTVPGVLGKSESEVTANLRNLIDGYFIKNGHHINVNVLDRETLEDAMVHPEKYPNLTIRVSGYAVNFVKLSKEHQREVIARTFHEKL